MTARRKQRGGRGGRWCITKLVHSGNPSVRVGSDRDCGFVRHRVTTRTTLATDVGRTDVVVSVVVVAFSLPVPLSFDEATWIGIGHLVTDPRASPLRQCHR